MNYRSKIFLLSGIYALVAIYFTKILFFNYYFSEEGSNLLPISFFEIVIFSIALVTFVITVITISILVKRNTNPVSFKKRFNFLIPSLLGWIIIFLLLQQNMSTIIVPVSIIIYGLIILNLNRFVTSRLVYFGIAVMLLGIISYFIPGHNWLFLTLGFGVFPIVFGLILLWKPKAQAAA
ncbi:hypothetical protein [Lutimonas vermicola]|uniref:Uncharacterized protein n=1 Tax=Lutimonas vermicola TaxID=414288 RepID=A0ABU9L2M1_9FLAO